MALGTIHLATVSGALIAYLLVLFVRLLLSTRRPRDFPPGPPTIPGLGNLHQMPESKVFLKLAELSKTYGDIVGLKFGPQNVVVLSDPADAHELLERRAARYSDRLQPYIATRLFLDPGDKHWIWLNDGGDVRRWRGAVRHLLGPAGVERALPLLDAAAQALLRDVLDGPRAFAAHVRQWAFERAFLTLHGRSVAEHGCDERASGNSIE